MVDYQALSERLQMEVHSLRKEVMYLHGLLAELRPDEETDIDSPMSEDEPCEEGFLPVKSRRKRRHASTDDDNSPALPPPGPGSQTEGHLSTRPQKKAAPLPLSSPPAPAPRASPVAGPSSAAPRVAPMPPNSAGAKRPPPITIKSKDNWTQLSKDFTAQRINILKASNTSDGIRVQVATPSDFRCVSKYLDQNRVPYFTYLASEEKSIKVVIRGVPESIPEDEIRKELTELGYPVAGVKRLGNQLRKFPLVAVHLKRNEHGKAIYQLGSLSHIHVTVETQRKSAGATQCYRCQFFGHAKNCCHVPPRCVKCAGSHLTTICTRDRINDGPPKCANCGGEHTANFRGCPKYPKPSSTKSYSQVAAPKVAPRTTAAPQGVVAPKPSPTAASAPKPAPSPPPASQDFFAFISSIKAEKLEEVLKTVLPAFNSAVSDTAKLCVLLQHVGLFAEAFGFNLSQ